VVAFEIDVAEMNRAISGGTPHFSKKDICSDGDRTLGCPRTGTNWPQSVDQILPNIKHTLCIKFPEQGGVHAQESFHCRATRLSKKSQPSQNSRSYKLNVTDTSNQEAK
jgi:hypothetical protein